MTGTNYKTQWMLAAILSCGLVMTSCVDDKTIPDNVSWGFLDVPAHTKGDAIWNTSHQFYCKTTKDVRAGYYLYVFTATALDALLLSTYAPVGSYFMDTLEEDYFGSQAVLIIRVR